MKLEITKASEVQVKSVEWLVLLMEGISPKVARRHRYEIEEKTASEEENNRQSIWLSR